MKYILSLILSIITMSVARADAQPIGTWNAYSSFCVPAQKTVVSVDKVYYLSGGHLFSYDIKNQETYEYTIYNKLTDIDIQNIYYNHDAKYLVIFYKSGNIDIVYDDGSTKNLSDLSDSELDRPMSINDVYFDGDYMYLATNFGLVQYNVKRGEVVQSGIFYKPVYGITGVGNHLVMKVDGYIRSIEKNKRFTSIDALVSHFRWNDNPTELIGIDDNSYLVYTPTGTYCMIRQKIDFDTGKYSEYDLRSERGKNKVSTYLIHGEGGKVYYWADNYLYTLDESLYEKRLTELPENFQSKMLGTWKGAEEVWSLDMDGLACHGFDGEGGVTLISDRYRPNNLSVSKICYFFPMADGRYLFMQNNGLTSRKFGGSTRGLDVIQNGARLDLANGTFTDFTCYPVEGRAPVVVNAQKYRFGPFAMSPTAICGDPDDPDIAFLAAADDGLYKVRGTQFLGRYDETNSPLLYYDSRNIVFGVSIDNHGNLWLMTYHNDWKSNCLFILPSDKRKLDPSEVKKEDWIEVATHDIEYNGGMDCRMLHCKHSNLTAIIDHNQDQIIFLYDNNGTPYNFTDDSFRCMEYSLIDQDGKSVAPSMQNALLEDHDGRIWLGTNEGVFEILNPRASIKSGENRVIHIKVPRNDGTNAADYLLGSDDVMDMTVDAANRKWIATQASGLFLVSPAGDKILANFTTDNSPLPTNEINAVYADPSGSVIYVGTPYGLFSYRSDATPARDDFDNILAYPNPVRPDYTGDIYISGLMEGSLVKIADSAGRVLSQGLSEGGLYVWDGCTSSGSRVKTGVYYVMVSSRSGESSSGGVTKIMVIN